MWQSESIKEIATALSAMQSTIKPLKANKENPFFKSSYADLEAVTEHIKPHLKANGLSFVQFPSTNQNEPSVVTQIMHTSGEWLRSESKLFLVKQDQQSVGSAITYAKRQALTSAFGVAITDEDDDGESSASMPVNNVRKLYKLAQDKQGVQTEHDFLSILNEYYGAPTGLKEIPKDDYKALQSFIETGELK